VTEGLESSFVTLGGIGWFYPLKAETLIIFFFSHTTHTLPPTTHTQSLPTPEKVYFQNVYPPIFHICVFSPEMIACGYSVKYNCSQIFFIRIF
jgi:hypothetical protein